MGRDRALDVAALHGTLGSMEARAPVLACSPIPDSFQSASCAPSAALLEPVPCGSASHLALNSQGASTTALCHRKEPEAFCCSSC